MSVERSVTVVVALAAVFFLAPGAWALIDAESFFDRLAPFPPYNRHLLHDIGAFQLGIGAALLAALRWRDAMSVALAGGAVGSVAHLGAHVADRDLGGNPTDLAAFSVVAALLLLALAARRRAAGAAAG